MLDPQQVILHGMGDNIPRWDNIPRQVVGACVCPTVGAYWLLATGGMPGLFLMSEVPLYAPLAFPIVCRCTQRPTRTVPCGISAAPLRILVETAEKDAGDGAGI